MPRLIAAIIRHGEYNQRHGVPSAHQPYGLTSAGEEQSRGAAAELMRLSLTENAAIHPVIDCSPLLRAWSTANIIADALFPKTKVESFDALAERGLGAAANLSIDEIARIVNEDPRYAPLPYNWKSDSHFRLPFLNAESLMESGVRIADHLRKRMVGLRDSGDLIKVFVGHGAAFRHAAFHLGTLTIEDIAKLSMHHARPILLQCDSGYSWRQVCGEWKLREISEPHQD